MKIFINILSVCFLIYLPMISIAQTDTSEDTKYNIKPGSLFFGISVIPSFSVIQNNYNGLLKGQPSFNGGINILYFLNSQIFLKAGMNYRLRSYVNKDVSNTANLIDSQGNIINNNITYYDINNKFQYFSSPMIFNFIVSKHKKSSIFFSGGIVLNYLFKASLEFQDYTVNGKNTEFNHVYTESEIGNRFTGTLYVGAGLCKVFLPSNIILLLQAIHTYDLLGLSFNRDLKFYTFGLSVEIYYGIRKRINDIHNK